MLCNTTGPFQLIFKLNIKKVLEEYEKYKFDKHKADKGKRITESDVNVIIETYKTTGSIQKTSEITGWSKVTVNRYVKQISVNKPVSRNFTGAVVQKDLSGNTINKFKNAVYVESKTGINQSSISQCISGKIKTAGGYIWEREVNQNGKRQPNPGSDNSSNETSDNV